MASTRVLLVFVLICGICIEGMSGLTCRICKSQSSRRSTGADNAEEIRVRSIGKHHKESDGGDSQSGSLTTTSPSEESSDASESVSEDAGSSQSESNSTSQESEAESDNRRQESSASSVDDDNDESVSEDAGSSESGTNSTSQEDVGSSENGSNSTSQESEAESDYRRQESSSSSDADDNDGTVSEDGSSESGTNSSESTSSSTEESIVGDFVRRQDPDANVTVNGTSPVGNFTDVGNATSADGNSSIIDPGGDYSNLTDSISVPAPGGGGCMLLPQPGSPASNATDDVVDGGNSTGDVNTTTPDFDFGGNSTGDVNTTAPDFDFGGNSTADVNTTAPDLDFGGNSTADVNTTAPDFEGNSTAGGSNSSATNSTSDTGDSGVSTNTSEPDPAIYPTPAGIFVYEIYRRDDEDDEDDDGDDDGEEDCEDDVIIAEGEQCFAMITKQGDGIVETYGSQGSEACSTNEGLNDIVTCGDPTLMAEGQTCTLCCDDEDNCNRNY